MSMNRSIYIYIARFDMINAMYLYRNRFVVLNFMMARNIHGTRFSINNELSSFLILNYCCAIRMIVMISECEPHAQNIEDSYEFLKTKKYRECKKLDKNGRKVWR